MCGSFPLSLRCWLCGEEGILSCDTLLWLSLLSLLQCSLSFSSSGSFDDDRSGGIGVQSPKFGDIELKLWGEVRLIPRLMSCFSNAFLKQTRSNNLSRCFLPDVAIAVIKYVFSMTRRVRVSIEQLNLANLSTRFAPKWYVHELVRRCQSKLVPPCIWWCLYSLILFHIASQECVLNRSFHNPVMMRFVGTSISLDGVFH